MPPQPTGSGSAIAAIRFIDLVGSTAPRAPVGIAREIEPLVQRLGTET